MQHSLVTVVLLAMVEVAGWLAAIHAILSVRTAQGAVAWAVSLVTFPFVSLPLYLVFGGRTKFEGYVRARRAGNLKIQHVGVELVDRCSTELLPHAHADSPTIRALERLARIPFTCHNKLELLINGNATFEAIFQGIESAKSYVLVQFYIVHDDELGRRLKTALMETSRQGVSVYFLCDAIGCYSLPDEYFEELRQAGVHAETFRDKRRRSRKFQLNFRNHRKIVVIDGHTAYVGGHNVGDEYLGLDPKLSPWRDTHVRVDGPAALGAQLSFVEDWNWVTSQVPELNWDPVPSGDQPVLILPSGPADGMETCSLLYTHCIHQARSRVWIVSPYFVPDESVMGALHLAALRGADVRVVFPKMTDNPLAKLAALSYVDENATYSGIQFWLYEKGFLHQKVMLIDDELAAVGTANLDNRSFRLNFEITAISTDRKFAGEVKTMLEADLAVSTRILPAYWKRRSLPRRVAVRVARLLSPVL